MNNSLINTWAGRQFAKPLVLVANNTYSNKTAKNIFNVLKVFWLLLIAGSVYYFIYINDNETQMKLFGLIAFVLAVISVVIIMGLLSRGDKTVKIDSTGIYTAKGSYLDWVNLHKVSFNYNIAYGKKDPNSITLHFDKNMATINKKDSHFPFMWTVLATVPTRQENHFYTGNRSRTQVIREA